MNKSFSSQERLRLEVLPFLGGILNGFYIHAEEGALGSVRVDGGKFIYGVDLQGHPLPVQRFARLNVECQHIGVSQYLRQRGIGCAILLVDANTDEIYLAESLCDMPHSVTLGQAIDILVDRHLALNEHRQALGMAE
jgi:hypothetical protein